MGLPAPSTSVTTCTACLSDAVHSRFYQNTWSDIQSKIKGLDGRLKDWYRTLLQAFPSEENSVITVSVNFD